MYVESLEEKPEMLNELASVVSPYAFNAKWALTQRCNCELPRDYLNGLWYKLRTVYNIWAERKPKTP
ncbi:unnamed protein product [Brassica rapa]|uniref:Uncharacterized protein n=2 Tax=Brassica TaxID=3705 RepID=A0A8D9MEF9_BRACM|nr:unnamed protein product [Brassica napus]CAG7908696.1 unnamed protein product [Brassica rapa]